MQFEDQHRLLDEANAVVREQAFYMKRAIDNDNLREALKHASNLICELRTSLLSPKNYYELYMLVFQELQVLASFFADSRRHNKRMCDLYESVQHAANILPRLYLLVTVGASYISSKEASAGEILKDVSELCKGVQHPTRGLFLRYYISQMMKNKLPDVGSEYETSTCGIHDAFEFILGNFLESMRLWCRIQTQGKDRARREKERQDLSALVGANLVRLSQLDGVTWDFYRDHALPKLVEQLLQTKDAIAQQYLLDCIIQVFPDDYHLYTLEKLLGACTQVQPGVDLKQVVVTLMNRLARFVQNSQDTIPDDIDIFGLFNNFLSQIVDKPATPFSGATQTLEVGPLLELQVAFMNFTLTLYSKPPPSSSSPTSGTSAPAAVSTPLPAIRYVDIILSSCVNLLLRHLGYDSEESTLMKLEDYHAVESVVEILSEPVRALGLQVFALEHYANLLQLLHFGGRKKVSLGLLKIVLDNDIRLTNEDDLKRLLRLLTPLLQDDPEQGGTPANPNNPRSSQLSSNSGAVPEEEEFATEQELVCKLVHQIEHQDTDRLFAFYTVLRSFFGPGGPKRLAFTLPTLLYKILDLLPRIRLRELAAQNGVVDPVTQVPYKIPEISSKKFFLFVHKTLSSGLNGNASETAVQIWLKSASIANAIDQGSGAFAEICAEFVEQSLAVFEEDIQESRGQFRCINLFVGVLENLSCLEEAVYDGFAAKVTQYGAKLLKKPQQVKAINICSHLFWNKCRQTGTKVQECLQKCVRVSEQCVSTNPNMVILFIETLDNYIYYYQHGCPEINMLQINTLLTICREHCRALMAGGTSAGMADADAREELKEYFQQILSCLRGKITDPKFLDLDKSLLGDI
ncbi:unnamed protein product [Amoebophrya sp. A120]|nr:unnamed protein product [Amoebophrya sp. A120]|eukprot:GSA120T00017741001.1